MPKSKYNKSFFKQISRTDYAVFFCIALLIALVYSKFVLTLSMIGLLTAVLFSWHPDKKFPVRINKELKEKFSDYKKQKQYWVISLLFFIVLVSGLYSSDTGYWLERLRIKLPFLLLPFVFAALPRFTERQFRGLFYFLLVFMSFSCLQIGLNYYFHYNEINQMILKGQAIPTPMSHIRYSLLLTISILGGINLFIKNFYWKNKNERWLIFVLTLFQLLFIHVLAVRSGLVCLYAALFVMCIHLIVLHKKYKLGIIILTALMALPFIAYQTVPSLKNKIGYMLWDLKQYQKGEQVNYSDSGRLLSYKTGWEVARTNLVFGVGAGDLKQAIAEKYKLFFPEVKNKKMPHNQFLSIIAGTGIIGLLAFMSAFFYPLFYNSNYREPLFLAIHISLFVSMLMENTIENAIGVAIYVFFILLCLNYSTNSSSR